MKLEETMRVTVTTFPKRKRKPKKNPKPKKNVLKFRLTLNLIGDYRQDMILLDATNGKPLNFRIESNSGKTLELVAGCYVIMALWKETKVGNRKFYRYVNPVMFYLDADLSIDLEQSEDDCETEME